MLLRLPALLTVDEIARAQALLADAAWIDGRGTAGPQAAGVKDNLQLRPDTEATQALQAMVLAALNRSALFFAAALPKRILPPSFNRYGGSDNPGGHYGRHVDQAVRRHPAGGAAVRADLSCTLFLADPAGYDGGELVVDDTFGTHACRLPAGDALLYPGSSVHQVQPVTRGVRLASFFWVESMVRSTEQRRLLFEMDRAIVGLRSRHGETDEAVALTGSYHNLLRMWADT